MCIYLTLSDKLDIIYLQTIKGHNMKKAFHELTQELKDLTGLYQHEIVTIMKDEITINIKCIKPPMGIEETDVFLANALLIFVKDGWTTIPF